MVITPLTVPGPQPVPLLGRNWNIFQFAQDSIGYSGKLFHTYGPIAALVNGGGTNIYSPLANCPGTICVAGPEFVRQVTSQHEVYYKYPLSGKMYRNRNQSDRSEPLKHFGVGLFGVNSDSHRQQRQMLMPAFHKQQIEGYRSDIVEITQSVLNQVQVGEQHDIAEVMRLLTMRIATKILFGEDRGNDSANPGRLLQNTLTLLGAPKVVLLPIDRPGFPYHRLLNSMADLDNQMRGIIQRKRQATSPSRDVLSMLIAARDEASGVALTEEELLGHVGVFFAAGHETSSNALTWTLFLLSQHPEIAANLLDELEPLGGAAPTIAQLAQLPYLERVIKESMRILPPVPWNGRVTAQPTELGGYALPAGTEVFVSIYHTHHQPEIFPQPETFAPDRWEKITPSSFEYNPFSAGPRTCIGAGFAMLEIKLILAMLLPRLRLQLVKPKRIDRVGLIVMAPQQGLQMQVFAQDRQFTHGVGGVRGNIREMVQLPA